jgi:hypothetical protein
MVHRAAVEQSSKVALVAANDVHLKGLLRAMRTSMLIAALVLTSAATHSAQAAGRRGIASSDNSVTAPAAVPVVPTAPAQRAVRAEQPARTARFDVDALGRKLGGWTKKGGEAAEYKRHGNHNYRTYKPDVSYRQDGSILVSTKVDHIRGKAKDDYSVIRMTFDRTGKLASVKTDVKIRGKADFSSDVIKGAALTGDPHAAAGAAGVAIVESLYNKASNAFENGGRAIFPSVIEHNINLISTSVRR